MPRPFFGKKNIFWREGVKLLVSPYLGTNETPLSCWNIVRLKLVVRDKMCNFDPKIWIFEAESQFLFWNRDFSQQDISPVHLGLQLSHWKPSRSCWDNLEKSLVATVATNLRSGWVFKLFHPIFSTKMKSFAQPTRSSLEKIALFFILVLKIRRKKFKKHPVHHRDSVMMKVKFGDKL